MRHRLRRRSPAKPCAAPTTWRGRRVRRPCRETCRRWPPGLRRVLHHERRHAGPLSRTSRYSPPSRRQKIEWPICPLDRSSCRPRAWSPGAAPRRSPSGAPSAKQPLPGPTPPGRGSHQSSPLQRRPSRLGHTADGRPYEAIHLRRNRLPIFRVAFSSMQPDVTVGLAGEYREQRVGLPLRISA